MKIGLPHAIALVLAAGLAGAPAQAETKLVEGYVSDGALQWPEYIADKYGWFKENGLAVDFVVVGGGAAQQVAAGSINLGYSGFPDFIRATNQGAHVKIVINGVNQPPYSVFAKPAIKTVAELKGKTISIGGTKDVTLVYVEAMLASAHLTAKDADFIYAKATGDRFAALVSGGADAAILYPPFTFRAATQHFTNLGDIHAYLQEFPFTVWAANMDWAAKNRAALLGYIRAYSRAVGWLYDPKNREAAVDILVARSKQGHEDSEETYDYFVTKLKAFSRDGLISAAGYKKMADALIGFGDLKRPPPPLAEFFDADFVKAAWK